MTEMDPEFGATLAARTFDGRLYVDARDLVGWLRKIAQGYVDHGQDQAAKALKTTIADLEKGLSCV